MPDNEGEEQYEQLMLQVEKGEYDGDGPADVEEVSQDGLVPEGPLDAKES